LAVPGASCPRRGRPLGFTARCPDLDVEVMWLEKAKHGEIVSTVTEHKMASSEREERERDVYDSVLSATARERLELVQSFEIMAPVVREGTRKLRGLVNAKGQDSCAPTSKLQEDVEILCGLLRAFMAQHPPSRFSGLDALTLLEFGSSLRALLLKTDFARHLFDSIANYPAVRQSDLAFRVNLERLLLLSDIDGNSDESRVGLLNLMRSLYLARDRNSVAVLTEAYASLCLRESKTPEAYGALCFGLHYFYPNMDPMYRLTRQMLRLSSGTTRLLINRDVGLSTKLICCLTGTVGMLQDLPVRTFGVLRLVRFVLRTYIRTINYATTVPSYYKHWAACVSRASQSVAPSIPSDRPFLRRQKHPENILITRVMGGIGDLLMMTPGIHALRKKHPKPEVHLAIPRPYFPVFSGNPDVVLLDIHREKLDPTSYDLWINLTDCPAERLEPATAPNVKRSRIEIFAASMGIGTRALRRSGTKLRFAFSEEELAFQRIFFRANGLSRHTVIGVHLKSVDSYKNYPHMEELVDSLRSLPETKVLIFDGNRIDGFDYPGVIKVDNLSLRKAFALASGCSMVIAPDSAFVHFAASQDIPTLALYGPTDGKVFTKFYDLCRLIDSRESLPCIPCWRHEYIPCKLTGRQESSCLRAISVQKIVEESRRLLSQLGRSSQSHAPGR
jgi:ADP-heptose:LPS heptosyltransferase